MFKINERSNFNTYKNNLKKEQNINNTESKYKCGKCNKNICECKENKEVWFSVIMLSIITVVSIVALIYFYDKGLSETNVDNENTTETLTGEEEKEMRKREFQLEDIEFLSEGAEISYFTDTYNFIENEKNFIMTVVIESWNTDYYVNADRTVKEDKIEEFVSSIYWDRVEGNYTNLIDDSYRRFTIILKSNNEEIFFEREYSTTFKPN